MVTIEYTADGRTARFEDVTGDLFTVECDDDDVVIDCLDIAQVSICGVLDAPRVDALIALLQRWRETGELRPDA